MFFYYVHSNMVVYSFSWKFHNVLLLDTIFYGRLLDTWEYVKKNYITITLLINNIVLGLQVSLVVDFSPTRKVTKL